MYEITITTRQIKGAALTLVLALLVLVSVLTVFADNNTTTNTSLNNTTNLSVQPMSANAAVTVSPSTVNLGTLMPDGTQHSYPGITTVRVTDSGLLYRTTLSVKASGAFVNTRDPSSTISLSNFMYDNPQSGAKTAFTTGTVQIDQWTGWIFGPVDETVSMNYYLTIPTFTTNGTYTTTITYSVS